MKISAAETPTYGHPHITHPEDSLRKPFNMNVLGPLAHVSSAHTYDQYGNDFIDSLQGATGDKVHQTIQKNTRGRQYDPEADAKIALNVLRYYWLEPFGRRIDPPTVLGYVTNRQHAALYRYFATASIVNQGIDVPLFQETITVPNVVSSLVIPQKPELHSSANLSAYLRDPRTPNNLRGLAHGGFGFTDSFTGRNDHPVTEAWRNDPTKPVFDEHGKPTAEVRQAGRDHRQYNVDSMTRAVVNASIELEPPGMSARPAAYYSSGCPARRLGFMTTVPELVAAGLSFTEEQVAPMMEGSNPVVRPHSEGIYAINRDTYTETARFLADALDAIAR